MTASAVYLGGGRAGGIIRCQKKSIVPCKALRELRLVGCVSFAAGGCTGFSISFVPGVPVQTVTDASSSFVSCAKLRGLVPAWARALLVFDFEAITY